MRKFWRRIPEYSIGIDFGTTISRIAYLRNDKSERVYNPQPPEYFPIRSLVSVRQSTSGNYEWNQGDGVAEEGSDIFRAFKLQIQLQDEIKPESGTGISMRPEILAARIIFMLRNSAAGKLGEAFSSIPRATVTIPAQWNIIGRKATIKAAQIAGINEVNLIEEPVAAFLAALKYRQADADDLGEYILVFDCGGGTLDVAVVKRPKKGVPVVIGRAMDDSGVAGEDIDRLLVLKISEREGINWNELDEKSKSRFQEAIRINKHNLNPTDLTQPPSGRATYRSNRAFASKNETALQALKSQIEPLSKSLSLKNKDGLVAREYDDDQLYLTFQELSKCIEPLETKIEQCINNAIRQATITSNVRKHDITAVILTGGSSYLRHFQAFVKSIFHKIDQNIIVYAPDSAIAQGAALYQQYIDTGNLYYHPTLALDTHLKYEDKMDEPSEEPLGLVKDQVKLPYSVFPWISVGVPTNASKIEWRIVQRRSSDTAEEVVEVISFERKKGIERLYLDYRMDSNGLLKNFRPRLLQGLPVMVEPSKYKLDKEKPKNLADMYNISVE